MRGLPREERMTEQSQAKPRYRPPQTAEGLLEGLNPEQAAVVQHRTGPLLVGAGAGTGKTTALVRRIAYLYRQHGVHPSEVLACTFSKKAATEMTVRLVRLLPGAVQHEARVGTMHSLAFQFWREENPNARRWDVDSRDRYRTIVKDALSYRGMDWKDADLTTVLQFIGLCKARCVLPGTPEAEAEADRFNGLKPCLQREPTQLGEVYMRAEALRAERQLLTFDDMLTWMWDQMSKNETCRAAWARRWTYVMQDEAQDENLVQRRILAMLAQDHHNYMIVGDPAQSIYGFRGSDPSGLLGFEAEWKATKILMVRNYRSGPEIIAAANGSLASMTEGTHLGMTLLAERPEPASISVTGYADADAEAEAVAQTLLEQHADGIKWKDQVVLYRTNAMSRALEEQLLGNRIPYVVIGGTNFYDRKEVKDLLAYLRIASGRGQFDDVRRSINSPHRYLGKQFIEQVETSADSETRRDGGVPWTSVVRELARSPRAAVKQQRQRNAAEEWCSMVDAMAAKVAEARRIVANHPTAIADHPVVRSSRPSVLIEGVLMDTKYVQWLTRDEGTESPENNRVSNVRELVRAAERFNTVDGLLDYIDETIEAARKAAAGEEDGVVDRVTLMSIHKSKGLEWKAVFLVGANEKILPHARCEDLNEERRLWYVAVTRARDILRVSYLGQAIFGGKVVPFKASKFIVESGLAANLPPSASPDEDELFPGSEGEAA
jgi:DNA helicase-2/ATP-dependent DNA helicase PcrA